MTPPPDPHHLGFTGTQRGMTPAQLEAVGRFLQRATALCFHHGDCVGADAQADELARPLGYRIHIHPPANDRKQAHCEVRHDYDVIYPPEPYLVRNRAIVDAVGLMIATPGEPDERLRSGTWSTVRYARRRGKRVFLVLPDGTTRT